MKNAAIVIDDYKQELFESMLTDAGYEYEIGPKLTDGTKILKVKFDENKARALINLVYKMERAARKEQRKKKMH